MRTPVAYIYSDIYGDQKNRPNQKGGTEPII